MSFDAYNQKKNYVLGILESCKEKSTCDDTISFIDERKKTLENNKFKIAVFGNFSVGKSKFLNALMGFNKEVLKEDELPCTAAITKLVEAKPSLLNKVEVKFRDRETYEIIDLDDLASYSSRNEENDVEGLIEEVILNLKSQYLENGIEIIDTPGFNSTYAVHTEIAKSFVKKSDASIFLFGINQAGTKVEFEFLRDVNQYISRVFFVMNKIDLCVQNNESYEVLIRNLEKNLIKNGISLLGKPIFPISAKKHHEGIMEVSEEKIKEGKFDEFTFALSSYLTSEENIKDRLLSPLHAIEVRVNKQREFCNEKLIICNHSKDEVKKLINEKKMTIEKEEDELILKKKFVDNEVNKIIRNAVKEFDDLIPKLKDELKGMTSGINSEFELELIDLPRFALNIYDDFLKCWNKVRAKLEDDIEGVIDNIVDEEDKNRELKNAIVDKIHSSFGLDCVELGIPPIDLDQVIQLDKQIELKREEYEKMREKYKEVKNKDEKFDEAKVAIERKKIEIKNLESSRDSEISTIGYGSYMDRIETEVTTRKRKGFLGSIANFLVGEKREEKQNKYRDGTDIEERNILKSKIKGEFNSEIDARELDVVKMIQDSEIFHIDETDVEEIKENLKRKQTELMEHQRKVSIDKSQMTQKIIAVNIQKFNKELDKLITDYSNEAREYLRKHRKTISRLIGEVLSVEESEISKRKCELQDMRFVSEKTPHELEMESNKIHKEIAETIALLEYIRESKEAI